MAFRSRSRRGSRRSYSGRGRTYSRRGYSRGRGGRSSGGRTVRIVVEQAAPATGSILPAANAAVQMASKRSMF